MKTSLLAAALLASAVASARSAIVITEVSAASSGNTTYMADWFEVTNTGSSAQDITGWKMDDNSNSLAVSVSLRGVTSIAARSSVVFIESNASGSNDAALEASFIASWFGTNAPANFTIGAYGGSGVGLSASSDAVNVFDAAGNTVARVDFGASSVGQTFDNAAGANNTTLATFSRVGVNGAFTSATGGEVGSPGAVPEPSTYALLCLAAAGLFVAARRRTVRG